MTYEFVILCGLFAVKHFLADYQFQTTWMVRGKRRSGFKFILPLLSHSLMHGFWTLWIFIIYESLMDLHVTNPTSVYLALIDSFSHFVIDRSKVLFGKYEWNMFSFYERGTSKNFHQFCIELMLLDQFFHGMVYLLLIYYMIKLT